MDLRELLKEFEYDPEVIYYKLRLDFSIQLKELMEEKGITKKELAKRMGVSPSYITKIFSGDNISLKTVAKVLAALQVDATIKLIEPEKIRKNLKLDKLTLSSKTTEVENESDSLPIAG